MKKGPGHFELQLRSDLKSKTSKTAILEQFAKQINDQGNFRLSAEAKVSPPETLVVQFVGDDDVFLREATERWALTLDSVTAPPVTTAQVIGDWSPRSQGEECLYGQRLVKNELKANRRLDASEKDLFDAGKHKKRLLHRTVQGKNVVITLIWETEKKRPSSPTGSDATDCWPQRWELDMEIAPRCFDGREHTADDCLVKIISSSGAWTVAEAQYVSAQGSMNLSASSLSKLAAEGWIDLTFQESGGFFDVTYFRPRARVEFKADGVVLPKGGTYGGVVAPTPPDR